LTQSRVGDVSLTTGLLARAAAFAQAAPSTAQTQTAGDGRRGNQILYFAARRARVSYLLGSRFLTTAFSDYLLAPNVVRLETQYPRPAYTTLPTRVVLPERPLLNAMPGSRTSELRRRARRSFLSLTRCGGIASTGLEAYLVMGDLTWAHATVEPAREPRYVTPRDTT